jgi:hypothetical protein
MSIYFGGGEIGMTKKKLDSAEIRPVRKHVSCKRMAQGMRRNMFGYTYFFTVFLYNHPEIFPVQFLAGSA